MPTGTCLLSADACGSRIFDRFALESSLEEDDGWLHRGWMHFLYPKKVHKETVGGEFRFSPPEPPLQTTKALSALGPALTALGVGDYRGCYMLLECCGSNTTILAKPIFHTRSVFHMPSGIFHKFRRNLFHCNRGYLFALPKAETAKRCDCFGCYLSSSLRTAMNASGAVNGDRAGYIFVSIRVVPPSDRSLFRER